MNIRLYGLDIETDTTINGLDPNVAAVTEVVVAGASWATVFAGEERPLLTELDGLLLDLVPGLLVTWNGGPFDMPFLADRYRMGDIRTALETVYDPTVEIKYAPLPGHEGGYRAVWGGHHHVDISNLYKQTAVDLGVRHSLKPVYKAVTGKDPIEVNREEMHLLSPEERRAYAASDGLITRELAELLPWETLQQAIDKV